MHLLMYVSEFRSFIKQTEKQLLDLFKSIDQDQNGILSKKELNDAFERAGIHVSSTKLDHFFSQVDSNKDGGISFDEWRYDHGKVSSLQTLTRKGISYYSYPPMLRA